MTGVKAIVTTPVLGSLFKRHVLRINLRLHSNESKAGMVLLKTGDFRRVAGMLVLGAALTTLSGCSVFHDRSLSYRQAQSVGNLNLPSWYRSDDIKPLHPIPKTARETLSGNTFTVPKPPDLTSEILDKNYVIEKMDGQMWLLVNEVPGQVWPALLDFLSSNGFDPSVQNPKAGLIQTLPAQNSLKARSWLKSMVSKAGQGPSLSGNLVLQAKVSPGVRRQTSEIQLRVRTPQTAPQGLMAWQSGIQYTQLNHQLLSNLSGFMKSRENTKSYSQLALQMRSTPKVQLETPESGPAHLKMDLSRDRAWTEIDRALKNANVPIVDINRSAGLWYVDFRTKDEREGGWFSWFSGKPKPEYTYQVKLSQKNNHLQLTAKPAPDYKGKDRSKQLLSAIYQHLY